MAYEISKLNSRHLAMVESFAQGKTRGQVAEEFGLSPEAVGLIFRSVLFQDALANRREELKRASTDAESLAQARVSDILREASLAAAGKMQDLLQDDDPSIQFRSAKDILDRTYGQAPQMSVQAVVQVTPEALASLKDVASEIRNYRQSRQVESKQIVEQA